jgi:type II secretory ATPase GspE/PulE/Tfp pilus assembly ATPase PilB-like protein
MNAFGRGDAPVERDTVLADWVGRHGKDGRLLVYRSGGCAECDQSGFKGRLGLQELMVVSIEMRHLIQTGARTEAMQKLSMSEGMRSLRQDGIEKVLAGLTTIDEVRATSNS